MKKHLEFNRPLPGHTRMDGPDYRPEGALLDAARESFGMELDSEFPLTFYGNTSGGILFHIRVTGSRWWKISVKP